MSSWAEAKWISDNIISHLIQKGTQPNNMKKFDITILSNSSVGLKFLEPDDIRSGGNLICATGGVMIRMSDKEYPQTINDGVLVLENTDIGKYNQKEYVVDNLKVDTIYYFTAFPFSTDKVYNMSQSDSNRVKIKVAPIYGIKRNINSSTPYWERTNSSKGLSATGAIGVTPGKSDFDNIYPWSDMKRETLYTGDVMVKIPEFYCRRYRDENTEYIEISKYKIDGFFKHPGSGRYLGAYKTSNDKYSKSGEKPTVNQTRSTMRNNAKSKGNGWGLIDAATNFALQMLFLVEFADNDSQKVLGKGWVNNSEALISGTCDNVPNLLGRAIGIDGNADIVYRGIEGIWGNIYEWVDGLNINKQEYYISTNPLNYADDTDNGYTKINYTGYNGTGYISKMGIDDSQPWAILPTEMTASDSTGFCDWADVTASGWRVPFRSGCWDYGSCSGLFCLYCYYSSADCYSNVGSRLLYTP